MGKSLLNLSRRHFLGMAAAAGLTVGCSKDDYDDRFPGYKARPDMTGEWKPAFCGFCHYPCCATEVKVVSGVAVEIRGDKTSLSNRGRLCPRGLSAIYNLYHPYRVKAPMKRTNPVKAIDNDPGWVEISWEEALNTVAEKLKAALELKRPELVIYNAGFGVEESMGIIPWFAPLGMSFLPSPGPLCPEHFNQLHLNGQMLDRIDVEYCKFVLEIGRTIGSDYVMTSACHSAHYADTLDSLEHIVVNPHCNHAAQRSQWVPILPGTDAALGLAMLYVMLVEGIDGSGTTPVYDHWFLKVRSNAPYLIDVSTAPKMIKGRIVYKNDYLLDPTGKPYVWNAVAGTPVVYDPANPLSESDCMGLEVLGAFGTTHTVNNTPCQTSLQILYDYLIKGADGTGTELGDGFTPEWQEQFTGIKPEKVREIVYKLIDKSCVESTYDSAHPDYSTTEFMGKTVTINGYKFPLRPAGIYMGRGMASHMHGITAAKALGTINLLLGNLDVPGGIQGTSNASWYRINTDAYGVIQPQGTMSNQVNGRDFVYPPKELFMEGYYPMGHSTFSAAWDAIKKPSLVGAPPTPDGADRVRFMFIHGADVVGCGANPQKVADALISMEFVTSIAYHYDIPSQFCDILFPEGAILERHAIYRMHRSQKESTDDTLGLMGTLIRKPVLDTPVYGGVAHNGSMTAEDIWFELIERMGKTQTINGFINSSGILENISSDYSRPFKPEYALPLDKKASMRKVIEAKIKNDFGTEPVTVNTVKGQQNFDSAMKYFEQHSFMPLQLPKNEAYNYWQYPKSKIRLPIYYQRMIENGRKLKSQLDGAGVTIPNQDWDHVDSHYSGMPVWYNTGTNMLPTAAYPFKLVNWKVHYGPNNTGGLYEMAHLNDIIDNFNPDIKRIYFPAGKAGEYGLKEGDLIRIESAYSADAFSENNPDISVDDNLTECGYVEGRVHLSQLVQENTIGIAGGFGRRTKYMNPVKDNGVYFNGLLANDAKTLNPISVSLESSIPVRIRKIG